jgi:hypothetical protein
MLRGLGLLEGLYVVEWEAEVGWMEKFGGKVVNDGGYSVR